MMNPNEEEATSDKPLPTDAAGEQQTGLSGREQLRRATNKISSAVSQTWDETKHTAGRVRERTEHLMRENPVPTILGAFGVGLAIGLAIRYASGSERKAQVSPKSPWEKLDWSVLSLPFLWPFFKSLRKQYGRSADAVADAMRGGVKRLKKIDVERYAKPVRKRWKAWTR